MLRQVISLLKRLAVATAISAIAIAMVVALGLIRPRDLLAALVGTAALEALVGLCLWVYRGGRLPF